MKIRIATPCSENLDAMPRDASGAYLCSKCDRAVVDLRRASRKRALAVIGALRAQGDGSVCARLFVRSADGAPVFAPEPSRLARVVGPLALVGSLAACAPQTLAADQGTLPVAVSAPEGGNGNGAPGRASAAVVTTPPPVRPSAQNVSYPPPDITAVAGGLAFSD